MKRLTLHPNARRWLLLLAWSLAGGVLVRGLHYAKLDTTALMYLGLPWLVALLLALIPIAERPKSDEPSKPARRTSTVRGALIVMLGSSVLLGEGFICVLMFLPIYLFVVFIMAIANQISADTQARKNSKRHPVHLIPLFLGLLALEGTHPNLSLERAGSVTVEQPTSLDRTQLWNNLQQPMVLNRSTPSGLSKLFPQPYQIDINSFEVDALHTVHYRYARWFWTNVHEGSLELQIDELLHDPTVTRLSARITNNTSYLANYLDIQRISLEFAESTDARSDANSQVSIQIDYRRTLDPVWYFSPLIKLALRGTASYLIQTHILRGEKILQGENDNV